MVCRECGAYNAEHLTHCRVCAAKLKDDAPSGADPSSASGEGQRPAQDFVKAPTWPTRAYSGAEKTASVQPAQPAPTQPAAPAAGTAATYKPYTTATGSSGLYSSIPARQPAAAAPAAPAQSAASVCPHCGKPTLSGALFCPYCGTSLAPAPSGAPAAAAASAGSARRQAPARPARKQEPAFEDEDFDEDEDAEDDEDFDVRSKKSRKKPVKKAKAKKKSRFEDDYDDDEEDDEALESEDEDDYEDEDEFDDDMPKKKSKGTTFLFWGLIILLVALVAVFGVYIIKKNFGGDVGALSSSLSSLFGGKKDTATEGETTGEGQTVPMEEDNMYTATISEYTDETTGEVFYDLDMYAPTGSTVRIITDAQLKSDTATVPSNDHVVLRVARDVFMPNAPCDQETITISPDIQVDTPDGETVKLKVDDITVTVPTLTMELTSPSGDTVQQTYNNDPILIQGTVDNTNVTEIYINGEARPISGGAFALSYTPQIVPNIAAAPVVAATAAPAATDAAAADAAGTADGETAATTDDAAADDATADDAAADDTAETTPGVQAETPAPEATAAPAPVSSGTAPTDTNGNETITIEAKLNNYVTARKVITIEKYVVQNKTLVVTNDPATGLSSAEGTVTLQGNVTYTADAKIVPSVGSDDTQVTFGTPAISSTGSFSVQVNIAEVGAYEVTLDATATGYNPSTTTCIVERPPTEKSSVFLKKCTSLEKKYDDIKGGTVATGNFQGTGKITEIISTSPYTIFKVQLNGTDKEVVCVNRSTKSTINSSKVGQKKQIMGSLAGTYEETGLPYVWVWYILNK
jgi:uncharacterized Zn finger protein (UPF0148 family)